MESVASLVLFTLQRHLESAVQLYKRRIDWLSVGCRKVFGTVVEKRLADIYVRARSKGNSFYRIFVNMVKNYVKL